MRVKRENRRAEPVKRPVGRPSLNTKGVYVKVEGDLAGALAELDNKNRYINNAIREKMTREGLLHRCANCTRVQCEK